MKKKNGYLNQNQIFVAIPLIVTWELVKPGMGNGETEKGKWKWNMSCEQSQYVSLGQSLVSRTVKGPVSTSNEVSVPMMLMWLG